MNGLFCGNSCTWSLIIVIVFLLTQGNNGGCGYYGGNRNTRGNCGCNSCGCDDDYEPAFTNNGGCGCR